MTPSCPTVKSSFSSGDHAALHVPWPCPDKTCRTFLVATSKIHAASPVSPMRICLPLGDHAAVVIKRSFCLCKTRRDVLVWASHNWMLTLAMRNADPSGDQAIVASLDE